MSAMHPGCPSSANSSRRLSTIRRGHRTDARARVIPPQARARDNSVTVETYLKELALCRTATGECPNFDKFQKMFGGGGGAAAAAVGGGGAAAAAATN